MSQDGIRLRFDRVFKLGTDAAKVAQYLETLSQNGTDQKADHIENLICLRYLPFAIGDFQSSKGQALALRSIYAFESVIQQLLVLSGLSDPRVRSENNLNGTETPNNLNGTEASSESANVSLMEEEPDSIDTDEEFPVDDMQSVMRRMVI